MQTNFFSRNYLIIFIFLLGVLHWLFFFFFVDYYSYSEIELSSKIEIHQNVLKDVDPRLVAPLLKHHRYIQSDHDLLKKYINEKNINFSKLFKFKKFNARDWVKEHKYQNVIAYSFRNFAMPFHIDNLPKLISTSNQFLGYTNYTLSPQIILLYFFDSEVFTFLNLFLMFTIGFVGCLLIRNYYKLNSLSFFLLFLIFNFNGYWIEKFTGYGAGQLGYFFFSIHFLLFTSFIRIKK